MKKITVVLSTMLLFWMAITLMVLGELYAAEPNSKAAPNLAWSQHFFSWKFFVRKEHSTPFINESLILIGTQSGKLHALTPKGKELWTFTADAEISGRPLATESQVFFGDTRGAFYCLNRNSGRRIWLQNFESPVLANPVLAEDRLFIQSMADQVSALNLKDGKVIWTRKLTGQELLTLFVPSSPIYRDGRIYSAAKSGIVSALRSKDGSVIWQIDLGHASGNLAGAFDPVIAGNSLLVPVQGRGLYALKLDSGERQWEQVEPQILSVALSSDKPQQMAYLGTYSGNVYALDTSDGKIAWQKSLGIDEDEHLGPLTYWQDGIWTGDSDGNLWRLNGKSGQIQWKERFLTDHSGFTNLSASTPNQMLLWSQEGTLYSFETASGR